MCTKKNFILILLGSLFFIACKNNKVDDNYITPESVVEDENRLLIHRDEIINNYIKSFNEIQDNLNKIKVKEGVVTAHSQSSELQKTNKDQIINDIQYIYDLLSNSKQTLAAMNKKFNQVNSKNTELQKFIDGLNEQINAKETDIIFLKDKLNELKTQLDALNLTYSNQVKESNVKADNFNTAYFAIGTHSELKKQGLIVKKGNVISIGNMTELNQGATESMFSKIDINQTTQIPIAANRVKLITTHPAGSYNLEDTKLQIKKLVILNPQKFWSVSKYLIIEVSNDKPSPHGTDEVFFWPD
jgi:hypothetical protein